MARMIGNAKSRLWWVAGIFCALLVGLAGCGQENPPAPKYGVPRPKTKPAKPEKPKAPAEKPAAPSETPKKG